MKRKVLLVVTILMLAFIWSQSAIPVSGSSHESVWFTEHIMEPLLRLIGVETITESLVRKIAHMFEYFVLSVLLFFLWRRAVWKTLLTGFIIAFLDETIQVISGRGPQITDVWIDLIGVAVGIALGWLVTGEGKKTESRKAA